MRKLELRQAPGLFDIQVHPRYPAAFSLECTSTVAIVDDGKNLTVVQHILRHGERLPADPWVMLRVHVNTSLDTPGVLAAAIKPLSDAKIGVFVLSTFEADLVLVRQRQLREAKRKLIRAGHRVGVSPAKIAFKKEDKSHDFSQIQ